MNVYHRSTWIWTLPLTFFIIGLVNMIVGFSIHSKMPGNSMQTFTYILGGIFVLAALFIAVYIFMAGIREERFEENAIHGVATIISREQTGLFFNNQPQVRFLLDISAPGREQYQVEHKEIVSLLDLGTVSPGAKFPVLIDRDNGKKIKMIFSGN